jgi:hypothetical protein
VDFFTGNGVRWHGIPDFIFVLYDITHSLAGIAVCYGLLVWWKRALLAPGAGLAGPCPDGRAHPRRRAGS